MPIISDSYAARQALSDDPTGIGSILEKVLNIGAGYTRKGRDKAYRKSAARVMGIPEEDLAVFTRQEQQELLKEKLKARQSQESSIALEKARMELDPEKAFYNKMFAQMGEQETPQANPLEGSVIPGTEPVDSSVAENTQINPGMILRGLMSKKFGVPYEQMMTLEEKKQKIQNEVDKAIALEQNKPLSSESAGKLAMVTQAEKDLNEAEGLLFPDGVFSPSMAFQTNFPGGGVPATEGRQVYSKVLNAVNAKLRVETGAQANPSEVKNILERFLPTMRDTDETAKDKFRRLKEFMSTTRSMIDPRGRFKKTENNDPLGLR